MHLYRFREADRLADSPFDTRPQRQMLALNFLRVPFAGAVNFGCQMPCVRPPVIRREACEAKGLQQRLELQKDLIFPTAKDIRQDGSCMMIDRMPQPALVAFLPNKAPHLVNLSFPSLLNVHEDLVWVHGAQQCGINRFQRRFFLPEFTQHGVGADVQHPCRITHTTGIEAYINDLLLLTNSVVVTRFRHVSIMKVLQDLSRGDNHLLSSILLCISSLVTGEDIQTNQVRYEYVFFVTQTIRISVHTSELA